jgi:hypothetical protein
MASDKSERLLNEIGQILAEDREYPADGTLLYARVDTNWVAPSIFKPRGNHILYRWPDLDRISGPLLDLWEEQEPQRRWAEIEYVIHNGKFAATFSYPDDIDSEEEPLDRRDRIVKRHFGDKPIVYPPFPEDGGAETFKV